MTRAFESRAAVRARLHCRRRLGIPGAAWPYLLGLLLVGLALWWVRSEGRGP